MSLTSTGVSWCGGDGVIHSDVIRLEAHPNNLERNVLIARRVMELITVTRPLVVCIEGYAFGMPRKGQSSRITQIAEMTGLTKHLVLSLGIPIIVVPPTTLKKFVTGKGNASKGEVTKFLKRDWGRAFTDFDRADAFAAMAYGQARLGSTYPTGPNDELAKPRFDSLKGCETINPEEIVKSISVRFREW